MFNKLEDALHYIENRRAKHSFEYFKSVLDDNHIDYHLPCIHVTGTNGKGGTIHFLSRILQEAGYKVGTFTSPYIICHQDRFMINDQMMEEDVLLSLINQYVDLIEKYNLAMFEIDFILMLHYFKQKNVDIALIEVGIGGRNDKTNMITPLASVITNVGSDHLSQIGPTIYDVAYEKAGIIKENVPSFIGEMEEELQVIFRKEAKDKNSVLHQVYETNPYMGIDIQLQMVGDYHYKNACMAISVIKHVFGDVSDDAIKKGLLSANHIGRFEQFGHIYLDGAHNMDAMKVLIDTVNKMNFTLSPLFVYAALKDKAYLEMARLIQYEGFALHVCHFSDGRALTVEEENELDASKIYESIDEAYEAILQEIRPVIVCGSLHFISQFRNKIIQNKK